MIINLYTVDGGDNFSSFFRNKNQVDVYNRYLELLIEIRCSIPYNLIGHIDILLDMHHMKTKFIWQPEYQKIDILLKIIEKDKTIEIILIYETILYSFYQRSILQRYYDLGGRK